MTKDEALKMAIEALLYGTDHTNAVKACKEALEQPAQNLKLIEDNGNGIKTYEILPKHQWQGITDDEVRAVREKHIGKSWIEGFWAFYVDIEAKLKEKNHGT
jgi:hypothetical protein